MKPPVRHRIRSKRLLGLKETETKPRVCITWYKKEQRSLRQGLSLQLKSNLEPDLLELQKKLPKRTLLEIQNLLKFLKASVVRRVYNCVQKQKHEEQRIKVPIEIWDELAQKMAAVHEETISSAFSQMLVIAATEPLSQLHSVPPRQTDNLISTHGMAKSSPSSKEASSLVKPPASSSAKKISNGSQSSSVAGQVLTKVSTPTAPKMSLEHTSVNQSETVSKIIPPVTTSKAATVSLSPNSNKQTNHCAHGNSKQDHQQGLAEKASTVDFGKIYEFISNINTSKKRSVLTAMESAVLLDLVMSLPEELPLLDCKELQHHLLQVYSSLTSEATVSIPSTVQRPAAAKPAGAEQHDRGTNISPQMQSSQTAGETNVKTAADSSAGSKQTNAPELAEDISDQSSVNPPKDNSSWATAGLFPLNPFMFPVSLLKRQQP